MGQREVLAWAKGHDGWHELREIAAGVGQDRENVRKDVLACFRDGDLVRKKSGKRYMIYAIRGRNEQPKRGW
jgi:hypothetical protein